MNNWDAPDPPDRPIESYIEELEAKLAQKDEALGEANEIKDLKGFMKAVRSEYKSRIQWQNVPAGVLTHTRIEDIIRGKINEAEYINQWVKE